MLKINIKNLLLLFLIIPCFYSKSPLIASDSNSSIENKSYDIDNEYYILGPGDKIFLRIYSNKDLSGPLDILNDGSSTFPLIGNVKITGFTIPQAIKMLRDQYKEELLNPELSIELKEPRPIKVSLIGEIKNPGIYDLDTSTTSVVSDDTIFISGIPTLVDAIRKSGGVTNDANLTKVKLKRKLPVDQSEEYKVANLDLLKLAREGDQYLNPPLFDGDIIVVPKASELAIEQNLELLSLNFSSQKIKVNVVGEVTTPGPLVLNSRTTLSQAILSAGGPSKWGADRKNVTLYRIKRNGSIKKKKYKFDLNNEVSESKNPILIDGDTILVGRTKTAGTLNSLNVLNTATDTILNGITIFKLLDD